MEPRRGVTGRRWVTPAVLAGMVALAATAGSVVTRSAIEGRDAKTADAVAAGRAASIDARLDADAAALERTGVSPGEIGDRLDASRFAGRNRLALGVAGTTAGGRTPVQVIWSSDGEGAAIGDVDLAARPAWRLALDLARDGASAQAAAAQDAQGTWTVLQARPLYGVPVPPASVAERRQQLRGYVVLLQPAAALMRSVAPKERGDTALALFQGDDLLTGVVAAGPPAPAAATNANRGTWTVTARPAGAASALPIAVLFTGVMLALVIGAVVAARERSRGAVAAAAVARANELGLIARIGPLLQQTLDLAELLPLFVVEVSDDFALEDTAVNLVTPAGDLTRAFSLGATGPADALDPSMLSTTPPSVPPDGAVVLPLQRGGRIVGAVTARAPAGLTASQLNALRAACDLLAAALGNAASLREEQDLVARLRELDGLKATFLGGVSHELRTMVVAIEGFADLLTSANSKFGEEQRDDFIQRIGRNARSLGVLVEDLLDFARFDSAGMSVTPRAMNLSDLVPKVIDQMSSILGERPVVTNIRSGVVAVADPAAIERILVNLLSNAAKYTPAGSEVTIDLGQADDMAVLCVSDRGPGIEPQERARVFELFYRVDNASARAARGVGIGLALVRQLADLLRGTVTAEEAPGGGARFRLEVPLASAVATTGAAEPRQPVLPRSPVDVQAS
jgi:signal transduction histidine kinase